MAGRRRGITTAKSSTSTTTPSRPAGSTPGTGGCAAGRWRGPGRGWARSGADGPPAAGAAPVRRDGTERDGVERGGGTRPRVLLSGRGKGGRSPCLQPGAPRPPRHRYSLVLIPLRESVLRKTPVEFLPGVAGVWVVPGRYRSLGAPPEPEALASPPGSAERGRLPLGWWRLANAGPSCGPPGTACPAAGPVDRRGPGWSRRGSWGRGRPRVLARPQQARILSAPRQPGVFACPFQV